jgi:DNA-directed RNA polymerase specialized sigma24 family protein
MEAVSAEITQESDASLMLLMGAAGESSAEDQALAREALRVLHTRHYAYLLGVLEDFAENLGTVVIDPQEFSLRTFKKAFQVANNFCDRSDGDGAKAKSQVRAWLGQIATNLARDELDRVSRLDKRVHFVVLDDIHDIPELPEGDEGIAPTEHKALDALQDTMATLKPEEHDILMTYALFGFPTEHGRELPEREREALMQRTGYERSNIRQKWCRLTKRLHTDLEPLLINQKYSCKTKLQSTQPTR